MNSAQINGLAEAIYQQNVEAGWYSNPETGEPLEHRNVPEMFALMHSELSEALEHWRKDTMDDHLPDLLGLHVELADTAIRILDFAGYQRLVMWADASRLPWKWQGPVSAHLAEIHQKISEACHFWCDWSAGTRWSQAAATANSLSTALRQLEILAHEVNCDLWHVVDLKLAYNRERADHKIENRKKPGGKKA